MLNVRASMKAIAYNIKPHEKELLTLANGKRHDLTLISNDLNEKTIAYAYGKDVVIISAYDILDAKMLRELKNAGINKIITRSRTTTHIDLGEARRLNFNVANTPAEDQSINGIAKQTVQHLHGWEAGAPVDPECSHGVVCVVKPTNTRKH